jgi:predicted RNA binding protein YcfA (HicA-like mRNA interferase family)
MNGKQVAQVLLSNGWTLDRINGSHHIYVKRRNICPVPVHGKKDPGSGNSRENQEDYRHKVLVQIGL